MDRRILLGAAFVLCAAGVFGLLNSNKSEPAPLPVVNIKVDEIPVWIARVPLSRGDKISPVDLQASVVTRDIAIANGVITSELFKLQEGAVAGMDMEANAIIAENQLLVPGQPEYTELLLGKDMVPYPINIDDSDGLTAMLTPGDVVDVVLIASPDQNLATSKSLNSFRGLSVTPLLQNRRVLEIKSGSGDDRTVVVSLTKEEVTHMMIARRIGLLDVYKSTETALPEVRVSDVLSDFTTVTELRGQNRDEN